MNFVGEDFIKKSKVRYMKCKQGDLHDGELLTVVCVDATCNRRGLICPVCRNQQHEEHKTISLKTFLQEASNRFSRQTNEHELTSLSDYLRQLDQTKKQLMGELNSIVSQLADKIKDIESKITQNYLLLRKMTLAESTISIKLPRLIQMMLDPAVQQDDLHIYEEFQKYALLASYGDEATGSDKGGICFEENAKKILEQYSEYPNLLKEATSKALPEIVKKLEQLPFVLDVNAKGKPSDQVKYTFSTDAKQKDIVVESKNKKATVTDPPKDDDDGECCDGSGGIILTAEGSGLKHQSITLKISNNTSNSMILGLALPEVVASHNYRMSEDESHGLFGISSSGYLVVHNNPDQQDSVKCFEFSNGDLVHIESDAKTKKITFSKKNTTEKCSIDVPDTFEITKMKFAVALYENDSIEIASE